MRANFVDEVPMQPERTQEIRDVVVLRGGPFDGATLEVDHADHAVNEIIFRTTEYFPASPREFVYRSHGLEVLQPEAMAKTYVTRVREWPFRSQEQSQVMERLQAQDKEIKRLSGYLSELVEENKRLKARLARKRKS
jgi:hypothetical protein